MREFLYLLLYKANYALKSFLLKIDRGNNSIFSLVFLYPTSPGTISGFINDSQTYWLQKAFITTTSKPGNPNLSYPTLVGIASALESNSIKMCVNDLVAEWNFTNNNIDSQKESCRRSASYGIAV